MLYIIVCVILILSRGIFSLLYGNSFHRIRIVVDAVFACSSVLQKYARNNAKKTKMSRDWPSSTAIGNSRCVSKESPRLFLFLRPFRFLSFLQRAEARCFYFHFMINSTGERQRGRSLACIEFVIQRNVFSTGMIIY